MPVAVEYTIHRVLSGYEELLVRVKVAVVSTTLCLAKVVVVAVGITVL
jgi:hypothetical protein